MPDITGSGPSPLERMVAAREAEKKSQRKKDSRVLVAIALVAVVVIGGGVFAFVRFAPPSWRHQVTALVKSPASSSASASRTATPVAELTVQPVSPVNPVSPAGPPADPFAGSPADHWADGAAGITIPAARAHRPYSAAQVRSAFQTTRKLLIAADLNWPTLRGGRPAAFEQLLTAPQRQTFLAGLHTTKVNKDGTDASTRGWITTFAPGSTKFVTTVVKVHGTMTARAIRESGAPVLRITVDYIFVYAVEPPGDPADWMRVVQQASGTVDFGNWAGAAGEFDPWYSIGGGTAGVRCDVHDGYVHPDYPVGPPDTSHPTGKPVNPYALATQAPGGGCQATTGT